MLLPLVRLVDFTYNEGPSSESILTVISPGKTPHIEHYSDRKGCHCSGRLSSREGPICIDHDRTSYSYGSENARS